jgi:uncharacterized membrane protein
MPSQSGAAVFDEYESVRDFLRQAFLTGAAVTLPLLVTLFVLGVVVDFVSTQLQPVVGLFTSATGVDPASELTATLLTLLVLLSLVFLVGVAAERHPGPSGVGAVFDTLVSRIPGVGSLYRSIDEMSGLLLDSDTDSFQEVKLVEFPVQGSYALGFLTADTPDVVADGTGHEEMVTVFVPMAPNPVMGGYVLHVDEQRVVDVDMTVEEGIQSIVTSGVATGRRSDAELTGPMLDRLQRRLQTIDATTTIEELEQYAAEASSQLGARMTSARGRVDAQSDGQATGETADREGDGSASPGRE